MGNRCCGGDSSGNDVGMLQVRVENVGTQLRQQPTQAGRATGIPPAGQTKTLQPHPRRAELPRIAMIDKRPHRDDRDLHSDLPGNTCQIHQQVLSATRPEIMDQVGHPQGGAIDCHKAIIGVSPDTL